MDRSEKDKLEEFFQQHTHDPQIPFNEADWEHLSAQLDREMPVNRPLISTVKKYWLVPLLILLALIGWWGLSDNEIQTGDTMNNQAEIPTRFDAVIQNPPLNDQESTKSDNGQTFSVTNHQHEPIKPADVGAMKTGVFSAITQPGYVNEESHQFVEDAGYVVLENGAEISKWSENSRLHFLSSIPPSLSLEPDEIDVHGPVGSMQQIPRKLSTFLVGLGYSPDFSSVGLGNYLAPGTRWKIFLEYNYKNTIALSSGLEYVNNKYVAGGDEYRPPYRYWYNGILPTEAYGECRMIDIPLNLRVQVFTRGKHQIFLSAGASTYFILREDYSFEYYQTDPNLPGSWSSAEMTAYPFGIMNASAGYEHHLSGKGSLQVEPYIKIPTGGIGWGNVDLYTIGVYIAYRYKVAQH